MKSCLLGLIAHVFDPPNNATDIFGKALKTRHSEVFRLSMEKDDEQYSYYLNAITNENSELSQPVRLYPVHNENRHRVTVGAQNVSGEGRFSLNSSYINLKRLFPIIDTKAEEVNLNDALTEREKQEISHAYNRIMQREAFREFVSISDKDAKNTLAPKDAIYDFNSISSGEDNLGHILIKMISFVRHKNETKDELQGIFCIDEFDASLHPVALTNLFQYMFEWSTKHNIQIVVTTHSLYLLDHCLREQSKNIHMKDRIKINIISTRTSGSDNNHSTLCNPSYQDAYKELTLKDIDEDSPYKVHIICEDESAKKFIKKILGTRIGNMVDFITEVGGTEKGTSCSSLISLGKNGKQLLEDSVIVVDADVNDQRSLEAIRRKGVFILKLPDNDGFAIERRVVQFLKDLDGGDSFFINPDKEKQSYLNEFLNNYEIDTLNIARVDITKLKKWESENKTIYNKLLARYVRVNSEVFEQFRNELLASLNKKRVSKGLPMLEY